MKTSFLITQILLAEQHPSWYKKNKTTDSQTTTESKPHRRNLKMLKYLKENNIFACWNTHSQSDLRLRNAVLLIEYTLYLVECFEYVILPR